MLNRRKRNKYIAITIDYGQYSLIFYFLQSFLSPGRLAKRSINDNIKTVSKYTIPWWYIIIIVIINMIKYKFYQWYQYWHKHSNRFVMRASLRYWEYYYASIFGIKKRHSYLMSGSGLVRSESQNKDNYVQDWLRTYTRRWHKQNPLH